MLPTALWLESNTRAMHLVWKYTRASAEHAKSMHTRRKISHSGMQLKSSSEAEITAAAVHQVLVISCGMPTGGALPWRAAPDSACLPWALDIRADPDSWQARSLQAPFCTQSCAPTMVISTAGCLLRCRAACWQHGAGNEVGGPPAPEKMNWCGVVWSDT